MTRHVDASSLPIAKVKMLKHYFGDPTSSPNELFPYSSGGPARHFRRTLSDPIPGIRFLEENGSESFGDAVEVECVVELDPSDRRSSIRSSYVKADELNAWLQAQAEIDAARAEIEAAREAGR